MNWIENIDLALSVFLSIGVLAVVIMITSEWLYTVTRWRVFHIICRFFTDDCSDLLGTMMGISVIGFCVLSVIKTIMWIYG